MTTRGYVVVLRNAEPGVTAFPGVPDADRLAELQRRQMRIPGGKPVQDPPKYLSGGDTVLGFTSDPGKAKIFATPQEAQAAIEQIPAMVRPAGLSVEPLNG